MRTVQIKQEIVLMFSYFYCNVGKNGQSFVKEILFTVTLWLFNQIAI